MVDLDAGFTDTGSAGTPLEHLILLVHGLWGNSSDWRQLKLRLAAALNPRFLIQVSNSNAGSRSYNGVDLCGERLMSELEGIRRDNPSLKTVSFIGHSMGGLLARYAAGRLFDPATCRIAGLMPRHFVSMSTPHLGCAVSGVAAVPFLGAATPRHGSLCGLPISRWLGRIAPAATAAWVGRTGAHLFLVRDNRSRSEPCAVHTGDGHQPPSSGAAAVGATCPAAALPLVEQLTLDGCRNGGSAPYLSALRSFATRTAYANTCGDALVGCANGTLRSLAAAVGVARAAAAAGRNGVVSEEPLLAAFWAQPCSAPGAVAALAQLAPVPGKSQAVAGAFQQEAVERVGPELQPTGGGGLPENNSSAATSSRSSSCSASSTSTTLRRVRSVRAAACPPLLGMAHAASASFSAVAASGLGAHEAVEEVGLLAEAAAADPGGACACPCASASVAGSGTGGAAGGGGNCCSAADAAAGEALCSDLRHRQGSAVVGNPSEAVRLGMLARLASLPWRRIDVTFSNKLCLGSAHCNIQYNGPINFAGAAVLDHVVSQILRMEEELERRSSSSGGGGSGGGPAA